MVVFSSREDLAAWRRDAAGPVVLVPTMGALHAGHATLVAEGARLARASGGVCVVSVFVNPTQFDEPSDFGRYPRDLEADASRCADAGADAVFSPDVETVYPSSRPPPEPATPPAGVDRGLEDAHRPGHFAGVCQVVRRLFDLVVPTDAIFGEKDWQQLRVITQMAERDELGVAIHGAPTIREPDGLAMSSRNRFLSESERQRASAISESLRAAQDLADPASVEPMIAAALAVASITPDYAALRHADTLGDFEWGEPGRVLIAARVGNVRLLDNMPWPGESAGF